MDSNPSNGNHTTERTATIHPITAHPSDRRSASTLPIDGDTNRRIAGARTPQRLVLTVDEAAFLLSISRGLAYELVARGELPSIRLGRRIVISRVVLEKLTGATIA